MQWNQIVGIIGPKGSGKTYFTCELIRNQRRIAVFDTAQEPSYIHVVDEIVFGNPEMLKAILLTPDFSVAYRTLHLDEGFHHFATLSFLAGDMTMVIEEVDQLCSPHYIHEDMKLAADIGRHRNLNLIYICRAFSEISKTLTRGTNSFILFNTHEPRDLIAIEDRFGSEVSDAVTRLRRLQPPTPPQYLLWRDNGQYEVRNGHETERR